MFHTILLIAILAALAWVLTHVSEIKQLLQGNSTTGSAVDSPPTPAAVPPTITPPPTQPAATLPSGIDTPDQHGFVVLTGVTNSRGKNRCSIAEVGAALVGAAHASVQLNSGFLANGRWITEEFIGVCNEVAEIADGTTGAKTYRLAEPAIAMPGTLAFPPQFTVATATAYLNSLGEPNTGSGAGFSPAGKD
jgi:hypothetical protein